MFRQELLSKELLRKELLSKELLTEPIAIVFPSSPHFGHALTHFSDVTAVDLDLSRPNQTTQFMEEVMESVVEEDSGSFETFFTLLR